MSASGGAHNQNQHKGENQLQKNTAELVTESLLAALGERAAVCSRRLALNGGAP